MCTGSPLLFGLTPTEKCLTAGGARSELAIELLDVHGGLTAGRLTAASRPWGWTSGHRGRPGTRVPDHT